MTPQEYQRDYRKAVIKELESRGLSDQDVLEEADKICGVEKVVEEGEVKEVFCTQCDSKGVRHKKVCPTLLTEKI